MLRVLEPWLFRSVLSMWMAKEWRMEFRCFVIFWVDLFIFDGWLFYSFYCRFSFSFVYVMVYLFEADACLSINLWGWDQDQANKSSSIIRLNFNLSDTLLCSKYIQNQWHFHHPQLYVCDFGSCVNTSFCELREPLFLQMQTKPLWLVNSH